MKRKFLTFMASVILSVTMISTLCLAAVKEYTFSDLNTSVKINSDLFVVTRATTSSDPALGILDVSIEELHVMLETNNVYLEAFPEDMSFEIVLAGGAARDDAKDFSALGDEEIINSIEHTDNGKYSVETINNIRYLVAEVSSDEPGNAYYVYKYTTVDKGIATTLSLQSEKKPDNETLLYFKEAVGSLERREIKSSLTENPYFTELATTIMGMAVVIGGLGFILFIFIRVDKNNRKNRHSN